MKSKKILKIIIIIVLIILAIIGTVVIILSKKEKEIVNNNTEGTPSVGDWGVVENNIQPVSSRGDYYIVKNIVEKYYAYCNGINDLNSSEIVGVSEESISKEKNKELSALVDMLAPNYKEENKITINSIESKAKNISTISTNIEQMNTVQKDSNMAAFIVVVNTVNKSDKKINNQYFIIYLDKMTGTYSILPNEYVLAKYSNLNDGTTILNNIPDKIESNQNNTYTYETIDDGTYAKDMYDQYLWYMIFNPNKAYSMLDGDYAKGRFGSKDEFLEYVNANKKIIEWTYQADTSIEVEEKNETELKKYKEESVSLGVDKYLKTIYGATTQYALIDRKENYYIINEKDTMDYAVMLDDYTVDLPQFTEKYGKENDAGKVSLNAAKIVKALKDRNYIYIYNKLNNTFKNNNFATSGQLKQYLESNISKESEFENQNVEKQNDVYVYTVKMTDKTTNTYKIIKLLIKLGNDANFETSFTIGQ